MRAGDDDVADVKRAALHQDRGNRTAAAVEPCLNDGAFCGTIGIGLEVEHFGLQRDCFEQLVEVGLLRRRDFDFERFAAHAFHLHVVLQELGADAVGLGVRFVDLVDRDDHRHLGRARVIDGLDRLRHHAVVGRNHQNHDVGHLGAARAHRGEGGVAWSIDEGDELAVRCRHLISADMLGNAAGFARHDIGVADGVEQRRLAMVDVAHDGDDGRARLEDRVLVGRIEEAFFNVGFGDALDRVAELLSDELSGIGVDHIGDLAHLALAHQQLDHVDGALRHAVRQFLDGDRLGQHDLAGELLLLVGRAEAFEALHAAAEGGDGAGALVVAGGGGGDGEAAAILLPSA